MKLKLADQKRSYSGDWRRLRHSWDINRVSRFGFPKPQKAESTESIQNHTYNLESDP